MSSVVFSPDCRRLASGSLDKTIKGVGSGHGPGENPLRPSRGTVLGVSGVVFSPDGRRLASGSLDKTIKDVGRGHGPGITTEPRWARQFGMSRSGLQSGRPAAGQRQLGQHDQDLGSGQRAQDKTLTLKGPLGA